MYWRKAKRLEKIYFVSAPGILIMLRSILRHIDGLKIYENWARKHSISLESFCNNLSPEIWNETLVFWHNFEKAGNVSIASRGIKLGGGGGYPFLYFICRLKKPTIVVETGVAAGWSSAAILKALKKNRKGKLYSTDLPYKKRPGAEEAIGMLVNDDLRRNWFLDTNGDRLGLPMILKLVEKIDLFHFDSDKSYRGREYALQTLEKKFSSDAILIFDDIQDNFHFKDLVIERNYNFEIFEFEQKFFGVIFLRNCINTLELNRRT